VWIGAILAHLDFLDEQIANLTEAIGEQIAPFEKAVELLCTIPGIQRRNAECIIAEIGVGMSIFPTAKQLASWAGMCPGNDQSAGRRRSGKTRSKWLDWALEETAMAAIRTTTPTSPPSTPGSDPAAVTRKRSAPSNTRSSASSGTCWGEMPTGVARPLEQNLSARTGLGARPS
jgi:hypothetical protein